MTKKETSKREVEPHEMEIDTTRPEAGTSNPSEGLPDDKVKN